MLETQAPWSDFIGLVTSSLLCLALAAFVGSPPPGPVPFKGGAVPLVHPSVASVGESGNVTIRSVRGGYIHVAEQANGPMLERGTVFRFVPTPDQVDADRTLSIPLSLNWHHPLLGLPAAQVVRFAESDGPERIGPERMHTILFQDHGTLPVLSLLVPHGALFDPDTGIMVVGNGIFHAPEKVLVAEARDPRSWKYPGNFHMRGKAWQRSGRMQFIGADGLEIFQTEVNVRINGQMTRSFPQHALRFGFEKPLRVDVFNENVGSGYEGLVLRTAGNDQIKAMLRDPFQHGLCAGLPFEVSGSRTCVVYVNGGYWGVHHLRHRMDEEELARRYGVSKKRITILEDEARLYRGDTMEVVRFEQLADRTYHWDGKDPAERKSLEENLDIDGFFAYMASQMILGNVDWPSQNVKFWKFGGKEKGDAPLDGKWRFIMGDCDLAYGVYASATSDMFMRVKALDVPLTRLFNGMMKAPDLKLRFVQIARDLAQGAFSAKRSTARLEALVMLMAPEMDRHTARWRRPGSVEVWQKEVDVLRTFAAQRAGNILQQLDAFEQVR